MNLITKIMTQNDCYKAGRTISPKGIMVHSTATPGVMAEAWYNAWNKPGVEKCVHAFTDDDSVYQYLPWTQRAWHCGGDGNNTHVAFEICEPTDLNNADYFNKAYAHAVELAVMLCKQFGLTEKDILCHCEGYKKGIASNHADVMHWFPKHNKSMDTFRSDVHSKLNPVINVNPTVKSIQELCNILRCTDENGHALAVDGVIGTHTRAAITKLPMIKQGSKCDQAVRVIQAIVGASNDGVFGPKTLAAVREYQSHNGLTADGIVGQKTWNKFIN